MRNELTFAKTRQRLGASLLAALIAATTGPIPAVFADHCASQANGSTSTAVNRVDTESLQKRVNVIPDHPVHVKTGPHEVHKFVAKLSFTTSPTDVELSTAHVLPELLAPMTGDKVANENEALAEALLSFHDKNDKEDLSALQNFVQQYSHSRWRSSIELNLGLMKYETASVTEAMRLFESAWTQSRSESGIAQNDYCQSSSRHALSNQRSSRSNKRAR